MSRLVALMASMRRTVLRDIITPLFVSNSHVHHIAALGVALEELDLYGKAYAQQVVRNAQTLATALDSEHVEIFAREKGYTQSHQIWAIIGEKDEAYRSFRALEQINIHVKRLRQTKTLKMGCGMIRSHGDNQQETEQLSAKCRHQTLKLSPQPHISLTLGLLNLKPSFKPSLA